MAQIDDLIKELDDVIYKLKLKIIYYQTENKDLKMRLKELKEYVKGK
tara:strand:+ start:72 stop:212 length:141 start_codon:yes stop_codon:yes gene_type:complete